MGFWDRIAKATGIDKDLPAMELEMAADPSAPEELLRRMAQANPALRSTVRQNPACPQDLAEWIDSQN